MQIDVKNGPEQMIIEAGKLIEKYQRQKFTVWGSFKPSMNELCFKHFGTTIPLFFDLSRCLKAYALFRLGCLDWFGLRESALIMPNLKFLMNPRWIAALNNRGISVLVFAPRIGALNNQEQWEEALSVGVNGICSDKPTLLQAWLTEHPLSNINQ